MVDSKAVLQDHLAGVQRQGETDLALLTDGLSLLETFPVAKHAKRSRLTDCIFFPD